MRSQGELTGLIKFLARDDWKSSFEAVMGEHFGAAMQAFDIEYESIGAALGGGWDTTLWGVAFEDFLGRQFEPNGRNFVDEYLRRRGWNEIGTDEDLHARLARLDHEPLRGQRHRSGAVLPGARSGSRRRARFDQ